VTTSRLCGLWARHFVCVFIIKLLLILPYYRFVIMLLKV
jgi:hypothetical protein